MIAKELLSFLWWLVKQIFQWLKVWQFRNWWEKHWFHVHIIATPIGSLIIIYLMSGASPTNIWNTKQELESAATFAPLGILIYTALAAMLEVLVIAMVLGFAVAGKFWEDHKARQKAYADALRAEGAALALEAERQRQDTGETFEEAFERLQSEGWQSPKS